MPAVRFVWEIAYKVPLGDLEWSLGLNALEATQNQFQHWFDLGNESIDNLATKTKLRLALAMNIYLLLDSASSPA